MTPALWLQVADAAADTLMVDGIERVTWWANAKPGRREFPRTIPEFSTLGLYEVTDAFSPPGPGLLFRRCPRPAQGSPSGRPTMGLLVVLITPRSPDEAEALRDWADFVHIHHIAEASVPGFTTITPYERVDGDTPRYLHLYEMDVDDPEAAFQAMMPLVSERLGGGFGTPAFDEWAMHPALQIDYVNTFRRIDT